MNKFFLPLLFLLLASKVVFADEIITYSHLSEDGYWQIWVMAPDGNDQKQITFSPSDKRDPCWMGEKGTLLFRTTNGELFKIELNDGREERLLENLGIINYPDYSMVRNEIVFVRFDARVSDVNDVLRSDLEGQSPFLLTRDNAIKFYPVFNHQGNQIVFVRGEKEKNRHHLWMVDTDGKNLRQLTQGEGLNTYPAFSPDDKTIVFSSNREGNNFDIYFLDLSKGTIKDLTNHPGLDTYPCFSADGEKILFVSNRGGSQQIWVMERDGSQPVQLTYGEESIDPVWGTVE